VRISSFPQTLYDTELKKRRVVGLVLLAVLLTLFLVFNRLPKLDTVEADLAAAASPKTECFQGFCFEADPDASLLSRWWDFSLTYLRIVSLGMVFAFW
jgi:cytochrome c biogenesis protein CcdA